MRVSGGREVERKKICRSRISKLEAPLLRSWQKDEWIRISRAEVNVEDGTWTERESVCVCVCLCVGAPSFLIRRRS